MDELDGILKRYFRGRAPGAEPEPLTDEEVRLFVEDRLEGERLERVLSRLAANPAERAWVAAARRRLADADRARTERVDERLIAAVSGPGPEAGGPRCPHCGKAVTPFKKSPGRQRAAVAAWTAAAAAGLLFSFAVPHYFLQGLAVFVVAGIKAALEHRGLKSQILIYRALEQPLEPPVRGHLHRDDARL